MRRAWRRIQRIVQLSNRPEARELRKLRKEIGGIPRYQAGQTDIWGWNLRYADAASCISAFDYIVNRGWHDFQSDRPDPRILDCGANIGIASLHFKRNYPSARITAFEPDAEICEILRCNLSENGYSDIEVIQAALWNSETPIVFHSTGDDSGRISARSVRPDDCFVATRRLTEYLSEPIDLLKIDIEGAEACVLRDSRAELSNVRRIVLEYHLTDDKNNRLSDILSVLEEAGFTYNINSPPSYWMTFAEDTPSIDDWMRSWLMIYASRLSA